MSNTAAKIVVVTGCTRGMGREMVTGFASAGCTIIGVARNRETIAKLASEYPSPHRFDAVDLGDAHAAAEWATSVVSSHGAPDLLVNNAALINDPMKSWDLPVKDFAKLMDVNVTSVFAICKSFMPAMIKKGSGVIVNVSSTWGRTPATDYTSYGTTKWAIEGMSKSMASEVPSGICVCAVDPGVVDTDMLRQGFGENSGFGRNLQNWRESAVPFLLGLNASHNGSSLSVPNNE